MTCFKWLFIAGLLFIMARDLMSLPSDNDILRPKVAVVLSGGGAKGFAHIGVLKVLEEEGIPIDIIVGTSMGGIIGGLYSIGYSANDLQQMALSQNWPELLSDNVSRIDLDQVSRINRQRYVLALPLSDGEKVSMQSGLIKGHNILNLFCGLTSGIPESAKFSEFPISFACVGTNLLTGEEVLLNEGFLPRAMFATMAIPGAFMPVEYDSLLLIDGGVVNNFPSDIAKKMGADIIIGVDVTDDTYPEDNITINTVMGQLISFYTLKKNPENRKLCDLLICPDVSAYNVMSFQESSIDSLISHGIVSAAHYTDKIREIKSENELLSKKISTELITKKELEIHDISFSGKYSTSEKSLKDNLKLEIPGKYTSSDIVKSINALYGTNNYKSIYFNLSGDKTKKNLNIILEEGKSLDINVGLRINSKSATSIVLNSTRKDLTRTLDLISLTADISSCPRINILFESNKGPKYSFMTDGFYKNLRIQPDRNSSYRADFFYASAELFYSYKVSGGFTAGVGIKEEYVHGKFNSTVEDYIVTVEPQEFNTNFVGYISFDNLDDYYFPDRGSEIYSELSFVGDKKFQDLYPILLVKMRNIIKLNDSFSLLMNLYNRTLFSEQTPGHLGNTIGGHDYEILLNRQLPFFGLPAFTPTNKFTSIAATGLRVNIEKDHFITFYSNYLLHNSELSHFSDYKTAWGGGLVYAYKSKIGPVEMMLGYSDKYKKPVISANIGYWF
jgi:NTE family protein